MKKLTIGLSVAVLAAAGGVAWVHQRADGKEAPAYKTAAITRGSLASTVSATGALQAVRTVQVGTQVSGQVAQIFVDFNDHVRKGQLLARIDPTLQQQAVEDAQAQVERAQATLTQAQDEYNRNKQLFDEKVLTAVEFATSQSNFDVQKASVKSAQIALDRAKQNLAYTEIYSPIDGVIVERNVDVGQTVAASLSAPQLFLIANDLSEMQILASVDESDIGQIKDGQPVQFTVQSYPGQIFKGAVNQVRLQSTTTDNVVNYTVVVSVKNDGGKLLPGMTATVTFTTASADNVLTVPNAALRLKPTDAMLGAMRANRPPMDSTARRARGDSTRGDMPGAAAGAVPGAPSDSTRRRGMRANGAQPTMLWVVDSTKAPRPIRVKTGLSDGQKTEVESPQLHEGMEVITSIATDGTATTTQAATSNPFQPGPPGGRGGPGGGGRGFGGGGR